MAENTKIEWAHHTFNPWVGCTKVSPGCDHCYAEGWANRTGQAGLWNGARRRTSLSYWLQVFKWDRASEAAGERHRVFCASLADVFDNQVSRDWRLDLFHSIAATPHLDWLLLTKRPKNIRNMLPPNWGEGWPNVWLGTTVENQQEADRRIPHLLAVPARVRFLSCEPLLGPVDLTRIDCTSVDPDSRGITLDALTGGRKSSTPWHINWVICGGESGPKARPMHPDWARSLRDQCQAAGVAFHFKQWGEWHPVNYELILPTIRQPIGTARTTLEKVGKTLAGRQLDGREWNEFPAPSNHIAGDGKMVGTAP
jgi:protein gp37